MAADLTIVNLSLSRFGQSKITQAQLTADVHPSAVAANSFYDSCLAELLGESDWPFATVTQTLSALAITDLEWAYVYSYPTATLTVSSVFNVFNSATINTKTEQEFERKYIPTLGTSAIFTNLDEAVAEYTYLVTTTSLWSRKFVTAFSYRLAVDLCITITGDEKKTNSLLGIYDAFIGEAKRLGHTEKRKAPEESSRYQNSR